MASTLQGFLGGASSSSSGGLFGELLGGAVGAVQAKNAPKPVTPWFETEKGIAIAAGVSLLAILLVLAIKRRKANG